MKFRLMIACGEVNNTKYLGLQSSNPVNDLLNVRNGSLFQRKQSRLDGNSRE